MGKTLDSKLAAEKHWIRNWGRAPGFETGGGVGFETGGVGFESVNLGFETGAGAWDSKLPTVLGFEIAASGIRNWVHSSSGFETGVSGIRNWSHSKLPVSMGFDARHRGCEAGHPWNSKLRLVASTVALGILAVLLGAWRSSRDCC